MSEANSNPGVIGAMAHAMRPLHWIKNLLLVVPLVAGHQLGDQSRWGLMGMAILAFCALASSMYLLNDVLDRKSDAAHPVKRDRPIAAGRVPVGAAIALAGVLLIGGLGLAWSVNREFLLTAAGYLVLTFSYSYYLKTKPIIDVICLAGLYALRIMAGGEAVSLFPSAWLMAFSMFFFLSLAFSKRYTELKANNQAGQTPNERRGYVVSDEQVLLMAGMICGMMAVLVLALYINSETSRVLYHQPRYLWLGCPVLLYWVTRVWLLANRGHLPDDPVMFAIRDRVTWLTLAVAAGILFLATY